VPSAFRRSARRLVAILIPEKILVVVQVVRRRCTAGDRRVVIHPANQAFAIHVENLLGQCVAM